MIEREGEAVSVSATGRSVRRNKCGWATCFGVLALLAASSASAQTYNVAVPLPDGVNFRDVVLGANGNLRVEASANIAAGAHSYLVNMGGLHTGISAGAKTGSVFSVPGVTVELAQVTGNITTEGLVVAAPFSTTTGKIKQLAKLGRKTGPTLRVEWPAASKGSITVLPTQNTSVAPGRYDALTVSPGGTIQLRSGAYYFDSYVLTPAGTVIVEESQGPVQIYVKTTIQHMGTYKRPDGTPPDLLVGYLGILPAYVGAAFPGTVIAPNAQVVIGADLGGTTHVGAFFAQGIEVLPFTSIKHRPTNFFGITGGNAVFSTQPKKPVTAPPGPTKPSTAAIFRDTADGGYWDTIRTAPAGSDVAADKYCTADDQPRPAPTDAQLNAPPAPGASCPAFGGTPARCPVDPDTLTNICITDGDCAAGYLCASGCLDEACTVVENRCGKQAISCEGLPAESNCDELYLCPEEGVVGTTDRAKVLQQLAVVSAPAPTALVRPEEKSQLQTYASIKAFDNLSGVICTNPIYEDNTKYQGVSKPHTDGKQKWGFYSKPVFDFNTKMTKAPNAVGEVSITAQAGYAFGGTVYGQEVEVLSAHANGIADDCGVTVFADVKLLGETVASFAREKDTGKWPGQLALDDKQNLSTPYSNREGCKVSRDAVKKSLLDVRRTYLFARSVEDYIKTNGLTPELCKSIQDGLPEAVKDVSGNKVVCNQDLTTMKSEDKVNVVNAWGDEFKKTTFAHYSFADQLATARSAIKVDANFELFNKTPKPSPFHVELFNKTIPVAWFPLNVAIEVYGGFGLGGSWKVGVGIDGNFKTSNDILKNALNGKAPKIGDVRVYTGPEVTPYAEVGVMAFIGVGFKALSVGCDGQVLLLRQSIPTSLVATAMRLGETAPRTTPPGEWEGDAMPRLSNTYRWVQGAAFGSQYELEALSGRLELAARVRLRFFKRTWKKKLFGWTGFTAKFPLVGGGIGDGALNPADDLGVDGEKFPYRTIRPFGANDLVGKEAAGGPVFPSCPKVPPIL